MKTRLFLITVLFITLVVISSGCLLFNDGTEAPNKDYEIQEQEESINNIDGEKIEDVEGMEVKMRDTVFYYVTDDGHHLVPYMMKIPWEEGIGRAAVKKLIDCQEVRETLAGTGLNPVLPSGTEILGLTIRDGLAKIDFNRNFLNFSTKEEEENGVNAVVYTLTEFPAVDKVQLMIEGKIIDILPYGTNISKPLERGNINLERDSTETSGTGSFPVTLYFIWSGPDGHAFFFVPVTRIAPKVDNIIKWAVEELVKGPERGKGLYSFIPASTRVLDVRVDEKGTAYVDFSGEIADYGGGIVTESAIINCIVLTLTQFPEVNQVRVLVEGDSGVLPEGTILDRPISRPVYINPSGL